jgi:hypothetical protein
MVSIRSRTAFAAGAIAVACCALVVAAPGQQPARQPLPLEPLGATGEAIFPAFEGWGPHKDGSIVLLLGYYNRNKASTVDIPIGPDNRIEPGGPDYGQPTHFEPSRQHGVFAIRVPKDFGNNKLTWTITVNGQTSAVSFWANPPYWINFFENAATGNQPPVIRFAPDAPASTGPPLGFSQTLSAAVGQPLALRLWASDAPSIRKGAEAELAAIRARGTRAAEPPVAIVGGQVIGGSGGRGGRGSSPPPRDPDITVVWKKHRAPGNVTFAPERIPLFTKGDPKLFAEAATTATFGAPGEYVLRAQVNDESGDGGGGDQCCWTTAHVRVSVK